MYGKRISVLAYLEFHEVKENDADCEDSSNGSNVRGAGGVRDATGEVSFETADCLIYYAP